MRTEYLYIIGINCSISWQCHSSGRQFCFPFTAEALVRSQASPCDICGAQSGTVTGFLPSTSIPPCQYHSTIAPHSSSSKLCSYQKDKPSKPGTFQNLCSSGYRGGGGLDIKLLSLFSLQTVNPNFKSRCCSSSWIQSVRCMEPP